jgi:hypothetical protein
MLGVIAVQTGEYQTAIDELQRAQALGLNPESDFGQYANEMVSLLPAAIETEYSETSCRWTSVTPVVSETMPTIRFAAVGFAPFETLDIRTETTTTGELATTGISADVAYVDNGGRIEREWYSNVFVLGGDSRITGLEIVGRLSGCRLAWP